jgi:hypothetical protein
MMSNPKIVGYQMVLSFQMNSGDIPGARPDWGVDDAKYKVLYDALKAGEAAPVQLEVELVASRAWIEDSLFVK